MLASVPSCSPSPASSLGDSDVPKSPAVQPAGVLPAASFSSSETLSLLQPPLPGKFLIVAQVSFGRYSNNRAALVDAVALTGLTRRTLLLPSPRACGAHGEALADVWDLPAIARLAGVHVEELDAEASLVDACAAGNGFAGGAGTVEAAPPYVHLAGTAAALEAGPGMAEGPFVWRGALWVGSPSRSLPLPTGNGSAGVRLMSKPVNTSVLPLPPPYAGRYPQQWMASTLREYALPDAALVDRLRALPTAAHACVAAHALYSSVDFTAFPAVFDTVQAALRPAAMVAARAAAFLRQHGLGQASARTPPSPWLALHLRLTDIAGSSGTASVLYRCARDPRALLQVVYGALRAWSAEAGGADYESDPVARGGLRLAVATDDPHSACINLLRSEFPGFIQVESGRWHSDSCREAAFVQEVLAAGTWFLGSGPSTFSQAVAVMRATRLGRPLNATVYMT